MLGWARARDSCCSENRREEHDSRAEAVVPAEAKRNLVEAGARARAEAEAKD